MSLGKRVASVSSIRSSSPALFPGTSSGTEGTEGISPRRRNLSSMATSSEDDRIQFKVNPDEIVYKASSLALLRAKKHKNVPRVTAASNDRHSVRGKEARGEKSDYLRAARRVLDFMCSMWRKQLFCDLVLQLPKGELHAHKMAFAAHSTALADKFAEYPSDEIISLDLADFQADIVFAITSFLYTTDLEINDDNVGQLLTCGAELGLEALVGLCRAYLSNYNVHNAILYHSIAETEGITDLRDDIFDFICHHFSEIVKSRHYPKVQFERIASLLSRDQLGVSSELEVFHAVVTWVNHDRAQRLPLAPMLMKCVRFHLMAPDVLVTKVEAVDWIFEPRECHNVLYDAFK